MMASVSTPSSYTPSTSAPSTNGATVDTSLSVPLDTIPVSPVNGTDSTNGSTDGDLSTSDKENKSDGLITVFHDSENFNVKHPLMNRWTLWFTRPPSAKGDNWTDLLKEVIKFDSVEEFWGIYNNITPTSQLALKADYHLFKEGVRPEWEDPQNKHGGKWSYSFREKRSVPIDELWLNIMLAAIGETLENEGDGEIMGVVVNVRKGFYRIGLWTKTAAGKPIPGVGDGDVAGGKGRSPEKSRAVLIGIGEKFKKVLELKGDEQVEFSGHTDSAASGSTRAKAKFTA